MSIRFASAPPPLRLQLRSGSALTLVWLRSGDAPALIYYLLSSASDQLRHSSAYRLHQDADRSACHMHRKDEERRHSWTGIMHGQWHTAYRSHAEPVAVAAAEPERWRSHSLWRSRRRARGRHGTCFETNNSLDQNKGLETNVSADTTNLPLKLEPACNETNSQPELTKGVFFTFYQ